MARISNQSYDKELRSLGYVDSGLSGSRGDYFILSYRPGAKKREKLRPGLVEIHSCGSLRVFEIHTPVGTFSGSTALKQALSRLG